MDWRDRPHPYFQVDKHILKMLRIIGEMTQADELTSELMESFLSNLKGALDVAEMPAALVALPVLWERQSRLTVREAIRPHDVAFPTAGVSDEQRFRDAQDRLAVTIRLARPERDPDLVRCIETAVRQALVLQWAAFEILANDFAKLLLNSWPSLLDENSGTLAHSVVSSLRARRLGKAVLEELRKSECPGTLLVETRRLQSLNAIQGFYSAVIPQDQAAQTALHSKELLELEQRRHLMVHRAGRVDRTYIEKTGSTQALGEEIDASPDLLKAIFSQSSLAALQIGGAVIRLLAEREASQTRE